MHEHFDDIIRRQLEGLESPVPKDMFDAIRNQPDVSDATFDAALRHKLQSAAANVPTGLFDRMSARADLANAPFDGFVQQQLSTHQSPVPADMWSRIMTEKDRRRPVAWWWVAAGLVLLLGSGTWYATQHSSKKTISRNKLPAEKNTSSKKVTLQAGNGTVVKKTAEPMVTDTLQGIYPAEQKLFHSKQSTPEQRLASNKQNANHTKVEKPDSSNRLADQEPAFVFTQHSKNKKSTTYPPKSLGKNGFATTGADPAFILNSTQDAVDATEVTVTLGKVGFSITQQLRNAVKLSPGQLLKARPRLPVIPCPTDEYSRQNNWYVDIYSSAFLVGKSISDKTAGKNAKTGFDSTLHRQVSYNAGINVVKNIGKNVLLKTGIQYNQLNESFRQTRINERKLVTIVSVRTVIIAPGDTVRIRDTSVTEKIGTVQRRTQNKFKQWDVPIIIGYEFGGEGIRLNANAGLIANIRSAYSGEMIVDTTQQIINAKDYNGKPVYKTNVGISLYAGLSIIKPLGEKTSLLIEPYARIGLRNVATEQAWFKQKNSAAGISVGLRYQLNGSRQRR